MMFKLNNKHNMTAFMLRFFFIVEFLFIQSIWCLFFSLLVRLTTKQDSLQQCVKINRYCYKVLFVNYIIDLMRDFK